MQDSTLLQRGHWEEKELAFCSRSDWVGRGVLPGDMGRTGAG